MRRSQGPNIATPKGLNNFQSRHFNQDYQLSISN